MKCVLSSLNARFVHSNIAIRYLKEYSKDYDIDIFEATINENILNIAYNILEFNPDIVGFSCYIWNIESTLKLCSTLKTLKPELLILLGGPEVSFNGCEILNKYHYIDFIIQGEGEITFNEFIKVLNNRDNNFNAINGLVFRNNGNIIENPKREVIKNMDILPFPYEASIPDKILYYEASRGCPFKCSYCLSSIDRGIRKLSIDRVKRDLKFFIDNDVKLVKFVDRTFNANKEFALNIWRFLIENSKNTVFHFEISADLLDEEELKLLSSAPKGLFQFEIGVQTTNRDILKNINRNMDFYKLRKNILEINKMGNIHCHIDIIAGLPGEDPKSFEKSFDMCMELKPNVLQLGFLKILKGAPVYYEIEKYKIKYLDYPPYQVLSNDTMPYDYIEKLIKIERIFDEFYNSGIMKITMDYVLSQEQVTFKFIERLYEFLRYSGYFDRNLNLNDKFKLFFDFTITLDKSYIIKDLLLIDYIRTAKKSYVPDFLRRDFPTEMKEHINKEKDKIFSRFKGIGIKNIFAAPVDIMVIDEIDKYTIINKKCIVVFNLLNGEYMFI